MRNNREWPLSTVSWRASIVAAVCVGSLVGVAGCGSSGPASVSAHYTSESIAFTHPLSWRASNFNEASSMEASLVVLSNQELHTPCSNTKSASEVKVSCGWPLHHLNANGIMAEWSELGWPSGTLAKVPGGSLIVGGLPAREQTSKSGECSTIGGTETISLVVARNMPANFYQLIACLRGPNLTENREQVNRMISSTTFPHG